MRCERLAPNTAVPQSATTANTVPSSALPTGTLAPPLLRSSALRTPISMLGGAPIDPRRPGSFEGFASTIGFLARAVRLARTAGQMPSPTTMATVASAPSVRSERIEGDPGRSLGGTRLPERGEGGEQGGNGHGAHGTREPHGQTARVAQHDQLPALQAECDQRRVFLALGDALTPQCLPDDREPDEGGQRCQQPPADRLGVHRRLDRCDLCVLVLDEDRVRAQRTRSNIEAREIGCAMPETHEVEVTGRDPGKNLDA